MEKMTLSNNQMEDFTNNSIDLFDKMKNHEQVVFCNDPKTGLKAIIAIHDTTLGPALGGTRMRNYASFEEALDDVLKLSEGMTYKCAAADVDFGGGKAVIIGDPTKDKTPELFRAYGQFVESLNGRFYTGTDMGTELEDFVHSYKETNCIAGLPEEYDGGGETSIPTAYGVLYSIKAVANVLWGNEDLTGRRFAIQGLGKVGFKVAEHLLNEGADIYVTDINEDTVKKIIDISEQLGRKAVAVKNDDIYSVEADFLVPCAIGGIINEQTINQLQVKAITGAANNQLLHKESALTLKKKGILYAPDYIVSSGGIIQVTDELYTPNKKRVLAKTKAIYQLLLEVFEEADKRDITTIEAANQICQNRIEARRDRNSFFSPKKRRKWQIRH
ncbi:leucine dehydrogenase [Alkalihalobacillus alcalophilus ATCC 27647 = CGMCC 1.3604]|uniref:Leucine dehydrogenase n=2 Tax=Alkalihalobacillus alcalophilus ATCC 27647 = CGMCC 1.3604 TaxID=1218173 RepID=A0A4S4JUY6_ALKAL|nr:Glu/Leu/Phe/Val dehydrogenase [Alkalihalobacillus alcalophilus]MED1561951.1 Glu/Leu/Phe/Val dehydrogenase [Alkalihalobacillus alcalophilus]THG88460.1 leucine dehydrogenase [Alkalihalobacillus alcalophilus ATCC 27647 = CGMCC 1.3604]